VPLRNNFDRRGFNLPDWRSFLAGASNAVSEIDLADLMTTFPKVSPSAQTCHCVRAILA
jgi:hypothetical protein